LTALVWIPRCLGCLNSSRTMTFEFFGWTTDTGRPLARPPPQRALREQLPVANVRAHKWVLGHRDPEGRKWGMPYGSGGKRQP
jgi:hypothetical protein